MNYVPEVGISVFRHGRAGEQVLHPGEAEADGASSRELQGAVGDEMEDPGNIAVKIIPSSRDFGLTWEN